MNRSVPSSEGIDQVLSDFFKSQMPHPWPSAPVSSGSLAEPWSLAVAHTAGRKSDPSRRARLTLAVSVAFLLGALWFMSVGTTPATYPMAKPGSAMPTDVLTRGSADLPNEFIKGRGGKARKDGGFKPAPINLP